jgi:O-antigen/teichoic acid export membrane protein
LKEILSKGLFFIFFRLGGIIAGYLYTLFITLNFGAEVYGLVALSFSVFLIIGVFGRLGYDTNIVKYFSNDANHNMHSTFFRALINSFVLSSALSYLIYEFRIYLVFKLFEDPKPELITFLPWILLSIPFWSITLISASYLRAMGRNNAFAFFNNPIRFLISLLGILFLYYFVSDSPIITVQSHFFAILISAVISLSYVLKAMGKLNFKTNTNSWNFLKDSFPMMLASSIMVILGWIDTFVMGIYDTNENVGIYNVCLKVSTLTLFTLQAINSILAPKIAKAYAKGQEEEFKSFINFATKINFLISVAVIILILIFNKFLLGLFGDEFLSGKTILFILCAGQLITSFSGPVGVILQMIGKHRVFKNVVLIALVLNIVFTIWLTPIYGGIGAAFATVISIAFWNLASVIYLKKKLHIRSYYNFK